MRLGIKTKPEHTPWPDLLDTWRAADDIELFESAWKAESRIVVWRGRRDRLRGVVDVGAATA